MTDNNVNNKCNKGQKFGQNNWTKKFEQKFRSQPVLSCSAEAAENFANRSLNPAKIYQDSRNKTTLRDVGKPVQIRSGADVIDDCFWKVFGWQSI
jgi:hypothetical protein